MADTSAVPTNSKIKNIPFTGYYALSDGTVMEAHEWYGILDYKDFIGGIYFTVYVDGEDAGGGVMEYTDSTTFAAFNRFIQSYYKATIVGVIAKENSRLYDQLEEFADVEPERFTRLVKRYNREPKTISAKKPASRKAKK